MASYAPITDGKLIWLCTEFFATVATWHISVATVTPLQLLDMPAMRSSQALFITLLLPILSIVAFLKLTASRPSALTSGSPKCRRFDHRLILCTLKIHLLTYLLWNLLLIYTYWEIQSWKHLVETAMLQLAACSCDDDDEAEISM